MSDSFEAAFGEALAAGLEALDIVLEPSAREACARFCRAVRDANEEGLNLTRIVDPREMAVKHVADSLTVLPMAAGLSVGSRVADVGTGAGFPGVPLKIARPDLEMTLIDSLAKRLAFLEGAAGVPFVGVHGRAEDVGRDRRWREGFDLVVARAVAPLPILLEWCGPLAAVGGRFVAMLGAKEPEDGAPGALGLSLEAERVFALPDAEGSQRRLRVYRKVRPTPARYPRRPSEIRERPLG